MAFHPEDRVVASCSEDKSIKLWNLDDGGLISTMNVDGWVWSVDWSPCGTMIAAACNDEEEDDYCVKILNSETGALLCDLSGHSYSVNSVCWNSDGTKLASGSNDHTVKVWDSTTGECLWTLNVGCYMFVDRRKPPHGGFPKPAFTEFGSAV